MPHASVGVKPERSKKHNAELFARVPLWTHRRIQAATAAAHQADAEARAIWRNDAEAGNVRPQPRRRFTLRALDLYVELRARADNHTGIVRRDVTQKQLADALNDGRTTSNGRWTVARATDILEAAGVITAPLTHDARGYITGKRYAIVLSEPDSQCGTEQQLACDFGEAPQVPAAVQCCTGTTTDVAPVQQQEELDEYVLDERTSSAATKSTDAATAAPESAVEGRQAKTERPRDAATKAQALLMIYEVLDGNPAISDPDLAFQAGELLKSPTRFFAYGVDEQQMRTYIDEARAIRQQPNTRPRLPGLIGAAPRRVSAPRHDDPVQVAERAGAACQHSPACPGWWSHDRLVRAEREGDADLIDAVQRMNAKQRAAGQAPADGQPQRASA